MALSTETYIASGVSDIFTVPFPFLAKAHVEVYIDGVQDTNYTWNTTTTVKTSSMPVADALVFLKRVTPTTPEVDFVDGSTLTESLLDVATIQALYVAEESRDALNALFQEDPFDSTWDAEGKRIKNVGNPVDPQDVATKAWSESAVTSSVAQAAVSATTATNKATEATTQANTATSKAAAAAASEAVCLSKASEATSQAATATAQAATATTQAGIATTKAGEAATSATNAAASASTASTQANTATTKATQANTSAVNALASENKAEKWADENFNVEVESGKYSAKHWAEVAIANAVPAPVSSIGIFAANSVPTGWLKANGAAVSRSTYSTLFAAIGTTFGNGDGVLTFNLPDLRGEFIRGFDDGRGVDSGRVFGTAQADMFESHTHVQNSHNHSQNAHAHTYTNAHGGATTSGLGHTGFGSPAVSASTSSVAATNIAATATNQNTGGVETRPRNVALLICIKY
jgi:microcystin-dependent protein